MTAMIPETRPVITLNNKIKFLCFMYLLFQEIIFLRKGGWVNVGILYLQNMNLQKYLLISAKQYQLISWIFMDIS